jgi:hypothetical protein
MAVTDTGSGGRAASVPTSAAAACVLGARLSWGVALVAAPRPLLRGLARLDRPAHPGAVAAIRVLGARHLAQTVIEVVAPQHVVGYLGAGTDALHAVSDLGLAILAPRWRRVALIDAAIATFFAVTTACFTHGRPVPQKMRPDGPRAMPPSSRCHDLLL